MSNRAIADFLGVSEYTVRKDIKDHEKDHDEGEQLRYKIAVAHAESEGTVRNDIQSVESSSSADADQRDQLRNYSAVGHAESETGQLRRNAAVAHPGVVSDEAAGGVDSQVSSASSGRPSRRARQAGTCGHIDHKQAA